MALPGLGLEGKEKKDHSHSRPKSGRNGVHCTFAPTYGLFFSEIIGTYFTLIRKENMKCDPKLVLARVWDTKRIRAMSEGQTTPLRRVLLTFHFANTSVVSKAAN